MADCKCKHRMINSVRSGNIEDVKILLKGGTDLDFLYGMQGTALCAAIFASQYDMVQFLLNKNCDVNAQDYDGGSPLCIAIRRDSNNIAELLINHRDCDLNKMDPVTLQTPLFMAVDRGNLHLTRLLIGKGCNINQTGPMNDTLLHKAVNKRNFDLIDFLLDQPEINVNSINDNGLCPIHAAVDAGADVLKQLLYHKNILLNNENKSISKHFLNINISTNYEKNTALHCCAIHRNNEALNILLGCEGLTLNNCNTQNQTAFYIACELNNKDQILALLGAGADPNCMAYQKKAFHSFVRNRTVSPLHLLVNYGNKFLVEKLVSAGANLNAQDDVGETPLFYALYKNKPDIATYLVNKLIEKELTLQTQDLNGSTALYALSNCSEARRLTNMLIEHGCKVNHINQMQQTPLFASFEVDNAEVAEILLDNGADVDYLVHGQSVLHMAAFEDLVDYSRLLIFYGADINLRTDDGDSALHIALENHSLDVAYLLINYGYNTSQETYLLNSDEEQPDILNDNYQLRKELLAASQEPVNLQKQCRISLRSYCKLHQVPMKHMNHLTLPKKLIDFLCINDL